MKREPIYEALLNIAKDKVVGMKNYSRRLVLVQGVPSVEMPALFQVQKGERAIQKQKLHTIWEISLHWVIYFSHGDDNTYIVSTDMNNLMDKVEELFAPDKQSGIQTLGLPNISHAWISDEVEESEGILGENGVVLIPIKILVSG
jgi:alkyl hydroperoxide reductase subunit AhpC